MERWLLGKLVMLLGLRTDGSYQCSGLTVWILAAVPWLLLENLALSFHDRPAVCRVTRSGVGIAGSQCCFPGSGPISLSYGHRGPLQKDSRCSVPCGTGRRSQSTASGDTNTYFEIISAL